MAVAFFSCHKGDFVAFDAYSSYEETSRGEELQFFKPRKLSGIISILPLSYLFCHLYALPHWVDRDSRMEEEGDSKEGLKGAAKVPVKGTKLLSTFVM